MLVSRYYARNAEPERPAGDHGVEMGTVGVETKDF